MTLDQIAREDRQGAFYRASDEYKVVEYGWHMTGRINSYSDGLYVKSFREARGKCLYTPEAWAADDWTPFDGPITA